MRQSFEERLSCLPLTMGRVIDPIGDRPLRRPWASIARTAYSWYSPKRNDVWYRSVFVVRTERHLVLSFLPCAALRWTTWYLTAPGTARHLSVTLFDRRSGAWLATSGTTVGFAGGLSAWPHPATASWTFWATAVRIEPSRAYRSSPGHAVTLVSLCPRITGSGSVSSPGFQRVPEPVLPPVMRRTVPVGSRSHLWACHDSTWTIPSIIALLGLTPVRWKLPSPETPIVFVL